MDMMRPPQKAPLRRCGGDAGARGEPVLSHVLFPTYVAAVLWSGLYLRDARLRALVPLRD